MASALNSRGQSGVLPTSSVPAGQPNLHPPVLRAVLKKHRTRTVDVNGSLGRQCWQLGVRTPCAPEAPLIPIDHGSCDAALQGHTAAVSTQTNLELQRLRQLQQQLSTVSSWADKVALLQTNERYLQFLQANSSSRLWSAMQQLPAAQQYVLSCLPAIGQEHILMLEPTNGDWTGALRSLAASLQRVEQFYDSMGGLVAYQTKSLELITNSAAAAAAAAESPSAAANALPHLSTQSATSPSSSLTSPAAPPPALQYHIPPGVDLAGEGGRQLGVRAAAAGLMALPQMAEILPVGGAGDRLGLSCEVTGEPLPSAMLPYTGRTMIELLVRDLQAREYLYYKLTGRQVTTPVAIMTSDAKGNHRRILELMQGLNWMGRGQDAFRLFRQPLVPVISAEDGRWLLGGPCQPLMKPGGHGAIWKLMHDEGVFAWLDGHRREAAIVRQISNPMAGTDTTLLALAGTGITQGKAFGFMSCERVVGAAEGMNVLQQRRVWVGDPANEQGGRWEYETGVTNVEYTEFERLGISDQAAADGSNTSVFPANTNILYIGLRAAAAAVARAVASGGERVLPGLIFNTSKKVEYTDPLTGISRKLAAGRMECTMQNLADDFADRSAAPLTAAQQRGLSTFMVYNLRRKVTSSAKKKRDPAKKTIHQTPDGSFYDLMRNAWQVLQRCGMKVVPEIGTVDEYLRRGPGFIFLFHPALGPLWDVIAQKVRGGAMMHGSELVLEVAEARLQDVTLDGSLLVTADSVMGHTTQQQHSGGGASGSAGSGSGGELVYSSHNGRVHLMNVTVHNVGVDWHHPGNCYWAHQVNRHQACRIILHGRAEFEALDVTISGDHTFEVPDGHKMLVTPRLRGGFTTQLIPLNSNQPSWEWLYGMGPDGAVALEFKRNTAVRQQQQLQQRGVRWPERDGISEHVLDFVI